jgi:outer membrane protein TolC
MKSSSCFLLLLAMLLVSPATGRCAERPGQLPSPITLEGAVNYALAHQPVLRAQNAQDEAADASLSIAREQLIPRGDIGLQENRATGNVVPGSHFSMAGIPPISARLVTGSSTLAYGEVRRDCRHGGTSRISHSR